jgi:small subunit ribosomal protein S16
LANEEASNKAKAEAIAVKNTPVVEEVPADETSETPVAEAENTEAPSEGETPAEESAE